MWRAQPSAHNEDEEDEQCLCQPWPFRFMDWEVMELESLYDLLQLPKGVEPPAEEMLSQGGKKRYLPPTSRKDPKFEELQKVLMEWINTTLLPEHIVVRSLEEDMFDGLILHHLFQRLAALKLEAEDIALTAASQKHKLTVVLEAVNRSLQLEERQAKWSVETIFNKDLLSTLHLLVALAKRFQPNLSLPTNVQVEVITIESTKSGLKSEKSVEQLTEYSTDKDQPPKDVFDELFKLAPEKVNAVKEAIVNFVNQKLDRLGLSVQNLDTQFADGVILLLLIGQLEGFFLHLKEFYLTPNSPAEMEVTLEACIPVDRPECWWLVACAGSWAASLSPSMPGFPWPGAGGSLYLCGRGFARIFPGCNLLSAPWKVVVLSSSQTAHGRKISGQSIVR
ncbi:gamma-parvin isoform X4 [Macaca nemestrina]|uniref:gamma-parvin isoform X4 n=1 Tax=Macaca nemestrina TaxID=9545 RepID=UPI0039B8CFEF